MCFIFALPCAKSNDIVRNKCRLKYILLAKLIYVVFH